MNKLQLMTGVDVPVVALKTSIHQPTIKEISYLGESEYFAAVQLLCFNKSTLIMADASGTSNLANMNNFEIFMTLVSGEDSFKKQNQIISALILLFPKYTVQFLPRSILFSSQTENNSFSLDEKNFDDLRNILEEVCGLKSGLSGDNGSFNPTGKKAAEIAAKLMRGRQKASQQRSGSSSTGILGRYVSVLTVGLRTMSLNDCLNLTVYQLYDLIERYSLWIGWDLDIRSRLAGGKPDEKPEDWMKDIH